MANTCLDVLCFISFVLKFYKNWTSDCYLINYASSDVFIKKAWFFSNMEENQDLIS